MADLAVILGCGYTGKRVAERLARRGIPVIATSRQPELLTSIPGVERRLLGIASGPPFRLDFIPPASRILYSIPTVDAEPEPSRLLLEALRSRNPLRLVYLSTTGVYGEQQVVNEASAPAPRRPQDSARLAAENAALALGEPALVLRPAAIYGPGRGIHVSMREGRFRMGGEGLNYVSRIHVDDLSAICEAAFFTDLTGAWPVADEHPCTTREIAEFCSREYGWPMPPSVDPEALHHTRRANRQVDGSAIRRALGVTLRYPSYREGIPASV